jgi:hypothetical protein
VLCSNSRSPRRTCTSRSHERSNRSMSSLPRTTTRLESRSFPFLVSLSYDSGRQALGDSQVYPDKGTVAFGSGLHGWAFTLRQFAARYSKKFGVDKEKMMDRLWGDNYFNPKTKKWTKSGAAHTSTVKAFVSCLFFSHRCRRQASRARVQHVCARYVLLGFLRAEPAG